MANSTTFRDIKFKKDIRAALMCFFHMESLKSMGYDPDPVEEDYIKGTLQEHLYIPGLETILHSGAMNTHPIPYLLGLLERYIGSFAHKQIYKSLQPEQTIEYYDMHCVWKVDRPLPMEINTLVASLFTAPCIHDYRITIVEVEDTQVGLHMAPMGAEGLPFSIGLKEITIDDKIFYVAEEGFSPVYYEVAESILDHLNSMYGTEWKLYSPS